MAKYPIFLELGGRRVADRVDDILTALCARHDAKLIRSKYTKNYLTGAVLVIAATNNRQVNMQVYKDCQELEILCNVVDDPEFCDFFVPAVVKRGHLQIAIGTEGYCPAYAGHLRKKLERTFSEKNGEFLAELETLRKRIIKEVPKPADRKTLLDQLVDDKSFDYFVENGSGEWRVYANRLISGED